MSLEASAVTRRWEREPATLPISLVLRADRFKKDDSATTLDISLYGVSVRTRLALSQGDWVGMIVKGEFTHAIPSRVVWVREDPDSQFTVAGLEFLAADRIYVPPAPQKPWRGDSQLAA